MTKVNFLQNPTTFLSGLHGYVFYVEQKQCICVVRLTQNSICSLRPADTLQNDELFNKVVIFFSLRTKTTFVAS